MTEEQKAIEQLRNESHTIGDTYVSHEGRFFVVVDGVAMSPGDALRGQLLYEQIVKMDLEGMVCKRKNSPYRVTESRHRTFS